MTFAASPSEVWRGLTFYEELGGRPPLHLRLLLPVPIRTDGRLGALLRSDRWLVAIASPGLPRARGPRRADGVLGTGAQYLALPRRRRWALFRDGAPTPDAITVLRSFGEAKANSPANRAADDRAMLWGSVLVRPATDL